MKDIPVLEPKEVITTITNMKTGEEYKDDNEWKSKGIPESDIRKDVRVIMPSLDLFGETKQNSKMAITNAQQYQQLVNKPADGKRPGYRGPGEYQGGSRTRTGNRSKNLGGVKSSSPEVERPSKKPGLSPIRSMVQFGHAGHAGKTEQKALSDQRRGRDVPRDAPKYARNKLAGATGS